jgi:hypothetical protein
MPLHFLKKYRSWGQVDCKRTRERKNLKELKRRFKTKKSGHSSEKKQRKRKMKHPIIKCCNDEGIEGYKVDRILLKKDSHGTRYLATFYSIKRNEER